MNLIKKTKKKSNSEKKSPMPKLGKSDAINDEEDVHYLVKCLIPTMPRIHWFHLNSTSYAEHEALGEFHDCLYELTDCLAEQLITKIGPIHDYEGHDYFASVEEMMTTLMEKVNNTFTDCSGLQNVLDDISTLLYKTNYKLTRLK